MLNNRMLDVCEDFLNHREWTYARLDGATTRPRRTLGILLHESANSDIRLFNQENSRISMVDLI